MSLNADSIPSTSLAPKADRESAEQPGWASTRLATLCLAGRPKGTGERLAYLPCDQDERKAEHRNAQRAELLAAERQQRDEPAGAHEG